jgi:trimeric autotransporter adhesin
MQLAPLARARLAPRTTLASLVLILTAALVLAVAAPASAVTRKQASKRALSALGSKSASGPVVVLGLPKALHANAAVTQTGSKKRLVKVGREGAYFFYEDRGPGQAFPHPGRVAVVGAKSGKVRISRTITGAPRINGRLPVFLKSPKRYRWVEYVVYDHTPEGEAAAATGSSTQGNSSPFEPEFPGGGNSHSPPKANPQTVTAKQNSQKSITLTGSDDDGDLLTFFITKPPTKGTLSGQPPDVTYTPNPGYLGKDDFTFRTEDGDYVSNSAKVTINVVPQGLPPVAVASAGCTAYTEQAPAVAVDPAITVADPDDPVLDRATVRISANFVRGDDLLFTDQNGISGSYDDVTGELTLFGTATVANYQAALRTVRYRSLAAIDPSATKDIQFVVNDGGSNSVPTTKQVCITQGGAGDNSKPIGETSEGALQYIENDGPVPIDAGFTVLDADSTHLIAATIKFAESQPPEDENGNPIGDPVNNFAPAEDELTFTDQNGITGSYDDTNGVMTLTGSATVAEYQTAIQSVAYENVSERPSDAPRAIRFQVKDSSGALSVPSNRGILVTPVNDAPVVSTTEGGTDASGENPAVVIDSSVTTGDVDDDNLESARVAIASGLESGDELAFSDQNGITGSYDAETGVLSLSGSATIADYETALKSVEYRNTGNPGGTKSVEFTVNDGDLDSGAATKDVQANDKPVLDASDDALAYSEGDGSVAVDPGITASDVDSANFAGATVQITSNFTEAEDELQFTDQNGISGSYDDTTGTLTLTGGASVADYQAALASVSYENSSDDPSDATRTVTFRVDDGAATNNLSDDVTRDVTVAPVNDAPVVTTSEGSSSHTEGGSATVVDSGLTLSDVDDTDLEGAQVQVVDNFQAGDTLTFTDQNGITSSGYDAESGVLTLTGTASVADYETALRSVEYSHGGDDPSTPKGVDFRVTDGELDSATEGKDVDVTPVNDAPALDTTDTALSYESGDGAVAIDPDITVVDPDSANLVGATITVSSNFTSAEDTIAFTDQNGITGEYDATMDTITLSGTASVADYQAALRSVTYENSSGEPSSATRTVTFKVDDGTDMSNAPTRDIEVSTGSGNQAPVVTTSDGATAYTVGDPAAVVDGGVTVTDADDTNIESAQVRISATDYQLGDNLFFTDQAGITGDYDEGTGVLTLTGSATLAEYQTALQSVTYSYTGEDPPNATKAVEFVANDGDDDSNTGSRTVAVIQIVLE